MLSPAHSRVTQNGHWYRVVLQDSLSLGRLYWLEVTRQAGLAVHSQKIEAVEASRVMIRQDLLFAVVLKKGHSYLRFACTFDVAEAAVGDVRRFKRRGQCRRRGVEADQMSQIRRDCGIAGLDVNNIVA